MPNMLLKQFAAKASWPLCLAIVSIFILLYQWYFKAGYLTFGDFTIQWHQAILPDAFHLWIFSSGLGQPDSIYWWERAFSGVLFALHADDGLAERIVWLGPPIPIFITGLYLLATLLTRDRTAGGVAALAAVLNVDFLVRVIGGHGTALMPVALAPWTLLSVVQAVRTRRAGWFALTALTLAVATAYDARWSLPTFVIAFVLAVAMESCGSHYNIPVRLAAIAASSFGLLLPNLPWIFATVFAQAGVAPSVPHIYMSPVWVYRLSSAGIWDALTVWNPEFGSDFSGGPFTILHVPWWGLVFPLLVAVSAIISRNRTVLVFFFLYLIGVFLYKGAQPPAGGAYVWGFEHIPFFNLYREPLKFGAATSLCACIVLSYGISILRLRSITRYLAIASACGVVAGLALPALEKPGLRVARRPSPIYRSLQSLTADQSFYRVLWLPQVSRWEAGTRLHPFVGGDSIGFADWSRFSYERGIDADPTAIVYEPIFRELLAWGSFRYIVVDCDVESDATIRSDSYSCRRLLASLSGRAYLRRVTERGALTVFRVRGVSMPALWSSPRAINADGSLQSYNAGALSGAFYESLPVVNISRPTRSTAFARWLALDGAQLGGEASKREIDRIIGADSVDLGSNTGDAVIDRQRIVFNGLSRSSVLLGQSTVAYNGAIAGVGLGKARFLVHFPMGALLKRRYQRITDIPLRPFLGFETAPVAIPVYERPALRIIGERSLGTVTYLILLELRDPQDGKTYTLVGPSFLQRKPPAYEFDVRDWLFRTIVSNARYDAELGTNDRFDQLVLSRVGIVQVGSRAPSLQRLSIGIRAIAPSNGYPVRSAQSFPAARYTCACSKQVMPFRGIFTFKRLGRRNSTWMSGIVVIKTASGSLTAIISRIDKHAVSGLMTIGAPFTLPRRDVESIEPAPDSAVVDAHLASSASGVLVIRGTVKSTDAIQVLLRAHSRAGDEWVMPSPSSITGQGNFVARIDLFTALQTAGYDRITDMLLFVKHRDPHDRSPLRFEVSGATVVSDRKGPTVAARLEVHDGHVGTNLSSGEVPAVAVFSSRKSAPPAAATLHPTVPDGNLPFRDDSGNKWLVFSQRFDPGWNLISKDGAPLQSAHVSAFQTLNAWYIPSGLRGWYRVVYVPDAAARLGGWLSLIGALACVALTLTLLRKSAKDN